MNWNGVHVKFLHHASGGKALAGWRGRSEVLQLKEAGLLDNDWCITRRGQFLASMQRELMQFALRCGDEVAGEERGT